MAKKASEIRALFLEYFEGQGHTVVESASLVPQNDPTLLFTNAGMVPFKDVFLGREKRTYSRATTAQKCVRAGGKHNDLENVGFTARHHTFFEMLGNFSFGDYFKKEAIHYAWEFVTKKLQLPKDKLYVSVYEKDDEAAEIWEKQEGIPKDRIYRFGDKDNFWAMAETGPCGPCSEIFIDRGEKYGCTRSTCGVGCECDRYLEFWNLVFMQFDRDDQGNLNPLPRPSVDTGAGLERIASILQECDTNYETDLFQEIIHETAKLLGSKYDSLSQEAFSYRVIADHARATAFLIGDGVMPSNEGRGYVLRRIMRRAIRHGKKLGFDGVFFFKVIRSVIAQMQDAYPDLKGQSQLILKAAQAEEEQFLKTLEKGLALLEEQTSKVKDKTLPGDIAFKLYDTYGFPLDLTQVILQERGMTYDEKGFERCMEKQRSESRKHWKGSGDAAVGEVYQEALEELKQAKKVPEFVGYEQNACQAECVAIFVRTDQGLESVSEFVTPALSDSSPSEGPIIEAVFERTPFYGESGGQVGDQGQVTGDGFTADVFDVQKPLPSLVVAHLKPQRGKLQVGKKYEQKTDTEVRALTARNHTATHILHWALRKTLGDHVKQAGSLVAPDLLRFDFTHFQALSEKEISEIETLINNRIWADSEVKKQEMSKDEAIAMGAIAFFGEKYGDSVRVVQVGEFSTELCGGTHVNRSSDIHLFKIASESGIAAGVRRIVAYTSRGAFEYLSKKEEELKHIRNQLKASSTEEIPGKLEKLILSDKELKKLKEKVRAQSANQEIETLLSSAKKVGAVEVVLGEVQADASGVKRLREISDSLKQKSPQGVYVLGMKSPDGQKASLLVARGKSADTRLDAKKVLQDAADLIEGKGGGKPDLAQAGGTKPQGLEKAFEKAFESIEKLLSS